MVIFQEPLYGSDGCTGLNGELVVEALFCRHVFNSSCIQAWWRTKPGAHTQCAICKHLTFLEKTDREAELASTAPSQNNKWKFYCENFIDLGADDIVAMLLILKLKVILQLKMALIPMVLALHQLSLIILWFKMIAILQLNLKVILQFKTTILHQLKLKVILQSKKVVVLIKY